MYYIEIKDQRKGLVAEIADGWRIRRTYSIYIAKKFSSRYFAKKYLKEKKAVRQYKIIFIQS